MAYQVLEVPEEAQFKFVTLLTHAFFTLLVSFGGAFNPQNPTYLGLILLFCLGHTASSSWALFIRQGGPIPIGPISASVGGNNGPNRECCS